MAVELDALELDRQAHGAHCAALDRRCDRERLDRLPHVVDAQDRRAAPERGDGAAERGRERAADRAVGSPRTRPSTDLREMPTISGRPSGGDDRWSRSAARGCGRPSCRTRGPGRGRCAPPGSPPRRRRRCAPRGRRPPRRRRRRSAASTCIVLGSPCMCIRQHAAPASATTRGHRRVAAQSRDVVHHHGAERERAPRDGGLARVDRDGRRRRAARGRARPAVAPRRAARGRRRPGRLAADVDDRGARLDHPPCGGGGDCGLDVQAAVREAVVGDVEDAHHRGRAGRGLRIESRSVGTARADRALGRRLHRRARERPRRRLHDRLLAGLGLGRRSLTVGVVLLDEDRVLGLAGEQPLELILVDRLALDQDRRESRWSSSMCSRSTWVALSCASSITRRISSSISLRDLVGVVGLGAHLAAEERHGRGCGRGPAARASRSCPKRMIICFADARDLLEVVRGTGRDLVEDELLGGAAAERHRHLRHQSRLGR